MSDSTPTSGSCPVRSSDKSGSSAASSWWPLAARVESKLGSADAASPASVEEAAQYPQSPQPDQRVPLSTIRMVSSIPRADELRPVPDSSTCPQHAPHQPPNSSHWVYPSEQQFYNAMRRKGYKLEDTTDASNQDSHSPLSVVPFIVTIHNAVNERCWMEICRWERELHNNQQPRLIRFMGRPNDMSPKAWINSRLLFKSEPFDRHDWFVDRGDGKGERRYVIDFYNGHEGGDTTQDSGYWTTILNNLGTNKRSNATVTNHDSDASAPSISSLHSFQKSRPSMFVDVRPALDTPDALYDRCRMFLRDAFPALSRWKGAVASEASWQSNSPAHNHNTKKD